MESMGWSFDITKITGTIDNHEVKFLAYDVQEREFTDNAVLVLGNIDANAYKAFLSAMNTFYYIGNPVLGKCIRCTDDYAVYHTNEKMRGKLFVCMQERTNIAGVPLVFCNHWYQSDREDDRDGLHFELLHQFGGDASRQFHIAVLAMDRRIIEKAKELEEYNVKWMQVD